MNQPEDPQHTSVHPATGADLGREEPRHEEPQPAGNEEGEDEETKEEVS